MILERGRRTLAVAGLVASVAHAGIASAQPGSTPAIDRSVTLMPPQGQTRLIDFTTDEGTWMALDVARDGRWLAFDMLGQVYRLPIEGGDATPLTANSGVALNFHPAISPDGRRIAFISDRQGQNNVWVMDADGRNPTPVFLDRETRFMHPTWAPDGRSIVAVRVYPTPGRGWHRQTTELWRLPLGRGAPTRVLANRLTHYDAPAFSPDGRYLYFHVAYSTGEGLGLLIAGHRIQRLELATGRVENVRTSEPAELPPEFVEALRRTGYAADNSIDPPAALTPVVSPDGRSIAFGLERADKAMRYRGHDYAPSTALAVRSLESGDERIVLDQAAKDLTMVNAQYAYGVFPRFAWLPDRTGLVAWEGGKLRRVNLATGQVSTIPFTARVRRVLSGVTRSRPTIDDSSFGVQFIQWPVGSPDGRQLAFVAAGKLWVMDLPAGTPREVRASAPGAVYLTPAWSRDGQLAFSTWSHEERGQVWVLGNRSRAEAPRRLTSEAGEYLHPAWTPDGSAIVVTRRLEPTAGSWNPWDGTARWTAVRVPVAGGAATEVSLLSGPRRTYFGPGGRLYVQHQDRAGDARGLLYYPFPSQEALNLTIRVRSMPQGGGEPQDELTFPASNGAGAEPVVSPTGKWVAFQSGRFVHVSPIPAATGQGDPPRIVTSQNDSAPGRVRVFDRGGIYHSWRDATTLQFASGNQYVTYDAATGKKTTTVIRLRLPRPVPNGSIALTNAKVITVDGDRVIERGTVVVRGSRIACVGTAGECSTAGVDRVMDLSGKTIIPGLFDMHAHHTTETNGVVTPKRPESALDLAYGVTTILDPAASSESAFPLAEMTEAGVVVGPRTYSVAELVIHPGTAWGDQKIIRTQADADREIDRRADWGAVSIKNFRQSARYQQQMLLQAARRRKITTTSEGGPLYFDVGVILDGQTGWEHLIANLPIYKDAALFFGKAGAVYSPTSIVAGHVHGSMQWFRQLQDLSTDPKYTRYFPAADLRRTLTGVPKPPKSAFSFPIIAEGLADIVRAGGHGVLGEHGEQPGIGTHWELWAYAEALTPREALRVATLDGAYAIGLERELGSITRGKIADLVVLDADPLADIRASARIAYVMKAGRLYDDDTLAEVWPERREYGPIPWR